MAIWGALATGLGSAIGSKFLDTLLGGGTSSETEERQRVKFVNDDGTEYTLNLPTGKTTKTGGETGTRKFLTDILGASDISEGIDEALGAGSSSKKTGDSASGTVIDKTTSGTDYGSKVSTGKKSLTTVTDANDLRTTTKSALDLVKKKTGANL